MLKGQKKHIDKEQGKTKHEAPRSVHYRDIQNKNNIGTTALERSVVIQSLHTKKYIKSSVRIMIPNSINASQRKHKIKSITVT